MPNTAWEKILIEKKLNTIGNTKIITSEGYVVIGTNISFDNKKKIISSNDNTKIVDKDGNEIYLEMFNYSQLRKNNCLIFVIKFFNKFW